MIVNAIAPGRTTVDKLVEAIKERGLIKFRKLVLAALGEAAEGIMSFLERGFARGVEDPHGIPSGIRQFYVRQDTGGMCLDTLCKLIGYSVELDGMAAHPPGETRRDKRRDNWNLVYEGIKTLRFEIPDVAPQGDRCKTAAAVITAWWNGGYAIG